MALPKGKLFALLAVFAAIGMVAATGAFTSVEAERTVSVDTAGDSSALLGLSANSTSANGAFATTDGDSELQIDVSNANQDATTTLNSVFDITNNGEQEVGVYIQDTSGDNVAYYWGTVTSNSSEGETSDVTLGTGERVSVGVQLNFDGETSANPSDITIVADAAEVGDGNGADGES
jgi:hypothetical protein